MDRMIDRTFSHKHGHTLSVKFTQMYVEASYFLDYRLQNLIEEGSSVTLIEIIKVSLIQKFLLTVD